MKKELKTSKRKLIIANMITTRQYFGKWKTSDGINDVVEKNAQILVCKVSLLMSLYGKELAITSGFRPFSYNKQIGGSDKSLHCYGQAIDLHDPDKSFGEWCVLNVEHLVQNGLYMESLTKTHLSQDPLKRWVHLQSKAPRSGNTIFLP